MPYWWRVQYFVWQFVNIFSNFKICVLLIHLFHDCNLSHKCVDMYIRYINKGVFHSGVCNRKNKTNNKTKQNWKALKFSEVVRGLVK